MDHFGLSNDEMVTKWLRNGDEMDSHFGVWNELQVQWLQGTGEQCHG